MVDEIDIVVVEMVNDKAAKVSVTVEISNKNLIDEIF